MRHTYIPAGEGGDAQEVELELCNLGGVLVREGHPFSLGHTSYVVQNISYHVAPPPNQTVEQTGVKQRRQIHRWVGQKEREWWLQQKTEATRRITHTRSEGPTGRKVYILLFSYITSPAAPG